ncbi:MAG: hypothetical protein K2F81_01195 [Ruminococcus sp.]|nr:hypothetical protein [Ruminococcus sp.]
MKYVYKIINTGAMVLFFFVVICAVAELFFSFDEYFKFTLLSVILTVAIALVVCYFLYKAEKVLEDKEILCKRLLYLMPIILLIFQVAYALSVDFVPKNDLSYICKGAENYIKYGVENINMGLPQHHQEYFYVYPNNHMLFLIILGLYKISYVFTGEISNILPIVLNIVSLNISYIFMIAAANMIYSPAKTCICALRGLMFTPLITFATIFYTDSLAMPFVSAGIYLYIKIRKEKSCRKCVLLLTICGIILALGYKIKGSVIILLAAFIVDILLQRYSLKTIITRIFIIITIFALFVCVLNAVSLKVFKTTKEEIRKYEFPKIHWIMMSADDKGGYKKEDFLYTKSFDGYDNKVCADLERLKEKIEKQGASGFALHMFKKIGYTWHDGTYMAPYYNRDNEFMNSNTFLLIVSILHFSILFKVAKGFFDSKKACDETVSETLFLKIGLVGLTVFLMIWETRCRYLISFMAIFALI